MATIRHSDFGARLAPLATCLLLACGHSEPFGAAPPTTNGPFVPGTPARLTLSPLQDLTPAWLPDGSAILYTYESTAIPPRDRCLGYLPAAGGTRFGESCSRTAGSLDSLDAISAASASSGGRLAYMFAQSRPNTVNPDRSELRVSTVVAPDAYRTLLTFPTNIAGQKVDGVSHIRWLSEARLVFLALSIVYPRPAPQAPPDTLPTGVAIGLIDLANAPGQPVLLAGSESASSVAIGPEPEILYFTRNGDGNVFRLDVASGTASVFFAGFSPFGIARDVALQGDRLIAIVGGAVFFADDPSLGRVQRDAGGPMLVASLTSGSVTQFPSSSSLGELFFRHPAMAASGAVVAEGYSVESGPFGAMIVSPIGDLWLFRAP